MTAVWELRLPDSEKLALLALADCANDEGLCWPSMATLARKCSKSDRTLQKAVMALCEKGHLSRDERPGKGVLYRIHPRSDVTPETTSPPKLTTKTPEAASDNPKRNINSPLPPSTNADDATGVDRGDQFWRVPEGRSWRETTGMLRELNRKPKRKPSRNSAASSNGRMATGMSGTKSVMARQWEDENSHKLRSLLKRTLGDQLFEQWFEKAALLVDQSELTVITASPFQSEWIEQNFRGQISSAARRLFADGIAHIKFQTGPSDTPSQPKGLPQAAPLCPAEIDYELPV